MLDCYTQEAKLTIDKKICDLSAPRFVYGSELNQEMVAYNLKYPDR